MTFLAGFSIGFIFGTLFIIYIALRMEEKKHDDK